MPEALAFSRSIKSLWYAGRLLGKMLTLLTRGRAAAAVVLFDVTDRADDILGSIEGLALALLIAVLAISCVILAVISPLSAGGDEASKRFFSPGARFAVQQLGYSLLPGSYPHHG